MEQRRQRVGDIVDDYCPRERRVTNHAVVAMIDNAIRQTRCTTCDAEHPFKGGTAPRRRRKDAPDALYNEVLSGMSDQPDTRAPAPRPAAPPEIPNGETPPTPVADAPVGDAPPRDEGPVRRPLIRATLPRPDGIPKERPAPEFTVRQPGLRGGGFRDQGRGGRGGGGLRQGSGQGGNGQRFGSRPAKPAGRFDRQQRQHGHQKKRSR
ncbi:MAG: hypothetical protein ACRD09_13310 [Vicinamibacterales bacterium]